MNQYQIFMIKSFAFQLSHWIHLQQMGPANGGISLQTPFSPEIVIDIPNAELETMETFFMSVRDRSNFRGLLQDNYRNNIVFFNAFYHHHIVHDLKKAKRLYKMSLRRTDVFKGSY
mmetsp:Transcript_34743/g.53364  ORF Transcript_34743/g.53364 Transcript_34743/m.53364 type:complete len:116 (-) Transcript_34743:41-388(-)